jgi:hypothetical protein
MKPLNRPRFIAGFRLGYPLAPNPGPLRKSPLYRTIPICTAKPRIPIRVYSCPFVVPPPFIPELQTGFPSVPHPRTITKPLLYRTILLCTAKPKFFIRASSCSFVVPTPRLSLPPRECRLFLRKPLEKLFLTLFNPAQFARLPALASEIQSASDLSRRTQSPSRNPHCTARFCSVPRNQKFPFVPIRVHSWFRLPLSLRRHVTTSLRPSLHFPDVNHCNSQL